MSSRHAARWVLGFLLSSVIWPLAGLAFANVGVGGTVENVELPALGGGKHALLSSRALANVFVFFRPGQERSLETLKDMALCEKQFAQEPVHWVAVVSSSWDPDEVKAFVKESGIQMPVLVDQDDALYGRIGVRLHPVIGVANEKFQLIAYEPFREINYCDRIRGKIRYALHEIDLAEVARTEDPPRALFPNEIKGAVAHRHVRMGEEYLRTKQYEKAASEARSVLETDPLYAPAQILLGDALAGQGRCAEASASYEAARKLDPQAAAASRGKRAPCASRK